MVKVWILSHGDCEDHGPLAVVATEEEAKRICKANNAKLHPRPPPHHRDWLFWEEFTVGNLDNISR